MIAVIALATATLNLVLALLVLAYVTKTGKESVESDKPDRPYNPKDAGSNWQPISKKPTIVNRIIKRIKGQQK